jgi:ABC-2 type transport system permease protein
VPKRLEGVLPIIQTPFLDDESLDVESLGRSIDWGLELGADGFGTGMVSEILRLTIDERLELTERLVEAVRGRAAVFAAVGAESARQAEALAQQAERVGCDAVMAAPPLSSRLSVEALCDYYRRLADATALTVIVQDASGYVGQAIPLAVYVRLHFTLPLAARPEAVRIEIAGAETELDDSRLYYRIVRLAHPLAAGERLPVTIHTDLVTRGFENEVSLTQLTQNGTFFNSGDFLPVLGYNRDMEVSDPNRRARLGLPPRQRMATLDLSDEVARSRNYVSKDADWVKMTTVISTAADQLAVAPGSLVGQWDEPGRRYFEYHLDHIALNFCSFISARYEVARERWQDVDIEVYHIPEHAYNVPNMLLSIRKSLEYYTENFGPYYHRQCRIIEFPRYSEFAQAFPGTMPYSEGIGFIADLRNVGPDQIDFVFYVVAHEMAHQYWAHQLVGADMQGSELLSEAFAQYSALMVMEREYGRENMRKFLRLEMDRYLAGRAAEPESEQPLIRAEHQGYIHYNKGSVVMYYLKEMIGEDRVNRALRMLLEQYAYQEPPYPTSLCAVAAFRSVTPPELQYLIDDWLEQITMMSNQTVETTCTRDGDQYVVRLQTRSEKFRVDGQGNEQPLPLDDFIDIGVFGVPEAGKSLGAPLVYERRRLTARENTFEFRVDELPHTAGIDPYNYLIDRQPHTNVQRVELR